MAWSSLDTRPWNLGALAFGVGACGPLVRLPADTDGDTQSDDDDVGPESSAESTPSATDSIGPGCGGGPPCPPNYTCIDGYCQYDYYCQSCCVGECGGYYECFSHEDCGDGYYCDYYSCRAITYLYNCPSGIALAGDLIPSFDGAFSLAFADVDGDGYEDIAALGTSAGAVLLGPNADPVVPIDLFGGPTNGHVVATEFDGESPTEITFSLFDANVLATFSVQEMPLPVAIAEPAFAWPVAADFDGNGLDDIAGLLGTEIDFVFNAGTQFSELSSFGATTAATLDVGELGTLPGQDFVYAEGYVSIAEVEPGGGTGGILEELFPLAVRTPVVADFDGNGVDDIGAFGIKGSGPMIVTWTQFSAGEFGRNAYVRGPILELTPDGFLATAVGDFDGDGADDVVVGGTDRLTIYFGSPGGGGVIRCWEEIVVSGGTPRYLATGDLDANGLDDLAWSDGIDSTRIRISG